MKRAFWANMARCAHNRRMPTMIRSTYPPFTLREVGSDRRTDVNRGRRMAVRQRKRLFGGASRRPYNGNHTQ